MDIYVIPTMAAEDDPSPETLVSVAIVDDQGTFKDCVSAFLEASGNYTVPYTALNGKEFVQRYGQEPPTCIALVDMFMSEMNGAETIHWFRAHWPSTMVLAMSAKRTPEIMREAVQAGAHGFLPKSVGAAELLEALERMVRRGSYFNDELLKEHYALPMATAKPMATVNLTPPEREVLDHVCAPDLPTYAQVAERTNKSPATVDSHRATLFKKLGVDCKSGLVSYGRANGYGKGLYSAGGRVADS